MALPIVEGSIVETPNSSAHIDAAPFRNAAFARGDAAAAKGRALAQGADAVSNFFDDVSQKFQANTNARTMLDADLKMRQQTDDFRTWMTKNPDENTWVPAFKEQADALKSDILEGPHVGPDVRRQLESSMARWDQAYTGEVTTAAQLKSLNRTKQTGIENYTYALRQGDMEGAMVSVKMMDEAHALQPWEADRMRKEAPGIAERAQVDTVMETNPQLAYQKLTATNKKGDPTDFKNLDPNERLRLTTQAAQRWHSSQSQAADGLREDVDNDKVPSDEQIKKQEDSGAISAKAASGLRRYIRQKDWAESRATSAELMSDASSYDPTADKDGKQFRDLQDQAVGLPQKYRDRITKTLQARVKDSDKSDDGMKTIDRLYEARTFGNWEKVDSSGKKTRDAVGWKKANDSRWEIQDALTDFRKKNPQATHKDERDFIMGQAQRHFDQQSTQAVLDGFSGTGGGSDESADGREGEQR